MIRVVMHACIKTQINSLSHSLSNQPGEVTHSMSGLIVFYFCQKTEI